MQPKNHSWRLPHQLPVWIQKALPAWLFVALLPILAVACSPSPRRMLEEYLAGKQATEINVESSTDTDKCADELNAWLDGIDPVDSSWDDPRKMQILATYAVSGDTLTLLELPPTGKKFRIWQENETLHQQTWELVTGLIPPEYRAGVTRFVLFSDGLSGALGAVEQPSQPGEWTMAVDIQDAGELSTLAATLIHETAHLLSLGPSQVETFLPLLENPLDETLFARGDAACDTYFITEGCSLPGSYLNRFYSDFWVEVFDEWSVIQSEKNSDAHSRQLARFYTRHADEFVSSYAATSPEEDLAESFLYFVLSPGSSGESLLDDKIQFFQQFPTLVTLRQNIRTSLCTKWEP